MKNRKKFELMKYAQLCKPGYESLTSSLACAFFSITLHNYLWLYELCYSFLLTWNRFVGAGDAAPKNIFLFYSKNLFNSSNIAEQIKKWNFCTMVTMNYRFIDA